MGLQVVYCTHNLNGCYVWFIIIIVRNYISDELTSEEN